MADADIRRVIALLEEFLSEQDAHRDTPAATLACVPVPHRSLRADSPLLQPHGLDSCFLGRVSKSSTLLLDSSFSASNIHCLNHPSPLEL